MYPRSAIPEILSIAKELTLAYVPLAGSRSKATGERHTEHICAYYSELVGAVEKEYSRMYDAHRGKE